MPPLPIPSDRERWHALTWLIALVSATGRIAEGRPQSLLIIGPPGSGKTENMRRLYFPNSESLNTHIVFATNASSWGVRGILKDRVPLGVTHIAVPELQTMMLRKGNVWDALVGLMLPMMEEGVWETYNGPKKEVYGGARLGLIAAITEDAYYKNVEMLSETGLLSRMLVVRFDRKPQDVLVSRYAYTAGDHSELEKVSVALPPRIDVHIPVSLANEITDYAAGYNPHATHREAGRFESLVKVVAHFDGAKKAERKHFAALQRFESFWCSQK